MQPTILVIEDDANTAALITLYCEREGFKTIAAADGATGLRNAVKQNPDLVVLDLMLPEMDGWDVCRQLRQQSDVPIIMLTARGDEVDRVSGHIADRLRIHGFEDGVDPRRESLGHVSDLTQIFLSVFDSGQTQVADAASRNKHSN